MGRSIHLAYNEGRVCPGQISMHRPRVQDNWFLLWASPGGRRLQSSKERDARQKYKLHFDYEAITPELRHFLVSTLESSPELVHLLKLLPAEVRACCAMECKFYETIFALPAASPEDERRQQLALVAAAREKIVTLEAQAVVDPMVAGVRACYLKAMRGRLSAVESMGLSHQEIKAYQRDWVIQHKRFLGYAQGTLYLNDFRHSDPVKLAQLCLTLNQHCRNPRVARMDYLMAYLPYCPHVTLRQAMWRIPNEGGAHRYIAGSQVDAALVKPAKSRRAFLRMEEGVDMRSDLRRCSMRKKLVFQLHAVQIAKMDALSAKLEASSAPVSQIAACVFLRKMMSDYQGCNYYGAELLLGNLKAVNLGDELGEVAPFRLLLERELTRAVTHYHRRMAYKKVIDRRRCMHARPPFKPKVYRQLFSGGPLKRSNSDNAKGAREAPAIKL